MVNLIWLFHYKDIVILKHAPAGDSCFPSAVFLIRVLGGAELKNSIMNYKKVSVASQNFLCDSWWTVNQSIILIKW